jgi:hypothetical protein
MPTALLLPACSALQLSAAASVMLLLTVAVPACNHTNARRLLLLQLLLVKVAVVLLLLVPLQQAFRHGDACCFCQLQQGADILPQLHNLALTLPELLLELPLCSIVPEHPHNLPYATPPALVAAVVLLHPTRCCILSCQHTHGQPILSLELSDERFTPLCTTYTDQSVFSWKSDVSDMTRGQYIVHPANHNRSQQRRKNTGS